MRTKTIVIGLLGLFAFAVSVPQADALGKCCRCKYSMVICCKPYNAFTPVCCGNICCTGCCPMQCGPSCSPCCSPCCPPSCPPMCCDSTLLSSNCCGSDMGHHEPPPFAPGPYMPPAGPGYGPMPGPGYGPMPGPGPAPGWTPPPPNPMVGSMWNMPAVQQTGYYPGYYPSYQPQGYWPMPVAVPSYWYGR